MNPTTRIVFIKKIIKYSLPDLIFEMPEQIELCSQVNDTWFETVVDYLDYDWCHNIDKYEGGFWHYAVSKHNGIKLDKFWEIIANKPENWFSKVGWNMQNRCEYTVWHLAAKEDGIVLEKFWEIIAQKSDDFFDNNGWNIQDYEGDTVWHKILLERKLNKFWEIIAQKDKRVFKYWNRQNSEYFWTVWYLLAISHLDPEVYSFIENKCI
jgi:hypothetical protein